MLKRIKNNRYLVFSLFLVIILYIFLHDLCRTSILGHSWWDSYTLQALAWRNGSLSLDRNYPYLELAFYNGKWFVSFPPVPTLIMLPFTFIFGEQTPGNLIIVILMLITVCFLDKTMRFFDLDEKVSALFSVCSVIGSNALWMSMNSGVWFMAQVTCLTLMSAAIYSAVRKRRITAGILTALAVGCRPFSIIWFAFLSIYYCCEDVPVHGRLKRNTIFRSLLSQWKYYVFPLLIGLAYMWLNYARFDNPFEFGHNYLPEFETEPQFSLSYIPGNLFRLFLNPISIDNALNLTYTRFNGFMFYIANPIFIIYFIFFVRDILEHQLDTVKLSITALFIVNILLLCSHKTLGGWQFGARYTVDLIPYVFFYIICSKDKKNTSYMKPPSLWIWGISGFGVLLNTYGAIAMSVLEAAS